MRSVKYRKEECCRSSIAGVVLQKKCYRRSVKCWSSVYSTGCAAGVVL